MQMNAARSRNASLGLLIGFTALACDGTPSEVTRKADRVTHPPVLVARSGKDVPKGLMQATLTQVTQTLAVALDDDSIRREVFDALRESPTERTSCISAIFFESRKTAYLPGSPPSANVPKRPFSEPLIA